MRFFRFLLLHVVALLIASSSLSAQDGGMWIPSLVKQLNIDDMQEMGLELSADDLYNINNSSVKDAIVHFGGGCTAEMISNQGLLLTNHHCGYGEIQAHSTLEHNYLKDGFWAK
ncbi:MAG: S46 family peptidase, partial [Flavobacteriales bacterium]|nr:S46 family peptidase [Flavobacteriales bacterium]